MQPELAIELDKSGYARTSLQKYLCERASIPYKQLIPLEEYWLVQTLHPLG